MLASEVVMGIVVPYAAMRTTNWEIALMKRRNIPCDFQQPHPPGRYVEKWMAAESRSLVLFTIE